MSIHVKHINGIEQNIEFPKLMISSLGQIVLALGPNNTDDRLLRVVMLYDNNYPIGDIYTKNFSKQLEDYHGEIILSNHNIK